MTNTGTTNGVQGRTAAPRASGVYGENTSGGGFGVRGRAGSTGHAVYGDNTGTGFAGYFEDKVHIGGALDCTRLRRRVGPHRQLRSWAAGARQARRSP